MPTRTARVFTIPASAPFLPTLIGALLDGRLVDGFVPSRDPLALAGATLYLPTRRACRLARDRFLGVAKQSAAILPRIVAIGDLDEDEIAFAQAAIGRRVGALTCRKASRIGETPACQPSTLGGPPEIPQRGAPLVATGLPALALAVTRPPDERPRRRGR
jgi:hypothetical protein